MYFDATQGGITAVVKANYGSIGLRLPNDVNGNGKIVVRDYEIENDLLSSFKMFNLQDGTFMLKSDREIYLFLSDEIPVLKEKAKLYYSDRFAGLKIMDRVDISASVTYNSGVDLLEADFESNLSYEQISGILSAVKLKKRFYRLSNGSFINLENSKQKDIFNLLDQLDFSFEDIKNGKKVIPKYHALYLNSLSSVEKNEEFKNIILNQDTREVFVDGRNVYFTSKEFDILMLLIQNPNKVISKEKIFREVWHEDYCIDTQTVTVHIKNIRKKIKEVNPITPTIETVWGIGFKIC